MILYLIRHGETDLNKQKRLQGQTDIPLNEYGRELARITGQALREVKFDAVFSSPLFRAVETAEIIMGNRDCPFYTDGRIQEISFGDYEGMCYKGTAGAEEIPCVPDADFLNFFRAPELYVTPPNGESFKEVIARTGDFYRELTHNSLYRERTVLISTHGCALKALLANMRPTKIRDFWGEGVHRNCAVTIVCVTDDRAKILEEGKVYY